jgi:hypothetical protein
MDFEIRSYEDRMIYCNIMVCWTMLRNEFNVREILAKKRMQSMKFILLLWDTNEEIQFD